MGTPPIPTRCGANRTERTRGATSDGVCKALMLLSPHAESAIPHQHPHIPLYLLHERRHLFLLLFQRLRDSGQPQQAHRPKEPPRALGGSATNAPSAARRPPRQGRRHHARPTMPRHVPSCSRRAPRAAPRAGRSRRHQRRHGGRRATRAGLGVSGEGRAVRAGGTARGQRGGFRSLRGGRWGIAAVAVAIPRAPALTGVVSRRARAAAALCRGLRTGPPRLQGTAGAAAKETEKQSATEQR